MPSNQLILCRPLLLTSIFPRIRVFSNESALCTRWPKYWSFRFSFSPSNEYSGLIYLGILGLTGLISLLFQESSPAPQFEIINSLVLSLLDGPTLTFIHDYQKNHTLTIWTFVGKMISLLSNTLSRFVMALLPRSKHILILWLQSPSTVEQIIPSIVIINIHNFFEILKCHSFRS